MSALCVHCGRPRGGERSTNQRPRPRYEPPPQPSTPEGLWALMRKSDGKVENAYETEQEAEDVRRNRVFPNDWHIVRYRNSQQPCPRCAELERGRDEARAELERTYRDALIALSQFTATPEEGYDDAPHCLVTDIERLGKERDDLKAKVGVLERERDTA